MIVSIGYQGVDPFSILLSITEAMLVMLDTELIQYFFALDLDLSLDWKSTFPSLPAKNYSPPAYSKTSISSLSTKL